MRRPTLRVPADRVRTPADLTYRLVHGLGRAALAGLAVRTRTVGAEHVPTSGPVIIAANHVSYVDFVFIQWALRHRHRRVRFLSRADVWQAPGMGPVMDAMGHVPVDRDAPAAAYLRARALLEQGHAVGIFPEAGISYSLTVRGLMRGVAALARETGAPVVPAAIFGSQRIYGVWPLDADGRELGLDRTRGRRVDVVLGAPSTVPPDADLTEWTRGLGERLTLMLEGIQATPEHRPRPGEWAPWYPAHLGGDALTRAEAREWDVLPRAAIEPTWGPGAP